MRTNIRRSAPRAIALYLVAAVLAAIVVVSDFSTALAKERRVNGQGVFWQITRPNTTPSHVLGTMHVTDPRIVDLPASVRDAVVRNERLVVEVVFDPEAEAQMARAMILTDGRTLGGIVGPKLFSRTEVQMSRYGLSGPQLNVFRPWAVSLLLSLTPAEMARQAEGQLALDRVLQDYAEQNGIPVYGLEDMAEQIDVFAGMSESDQVAMMDLTVALNVRIDQVFEKMLKIYLKGDMDRLHALSRELSGGTDSRLAVRFEKRLIDTRNRRMAERVVPHLRAGGAFVAVGALHLSGKSGLLRLLENKGYRVKRMR
jgi:uncharacterized protein YbaP (TraB family)